jgi:hypothetical protein
MTSNTPRSSAFTDELWHSIEPIYAAILRHPFIAGLTDGSLPRKSFEFYAVQDALYLRERERQGGGCGADPVSRRTGFRRGYPRQRHGAGRAAVRARRAINPAA